MFPLIHHVSLNLFYSLLLDFFVYLLFIFYCPRYLNTISTEDLLPNFKVDVLLANQSYMIKKKKQICDWRIEIIHINNRKTHTTQFNQLVSCIFYYCALHNALL